MRRLVLAVTAFGSLVALPAGAATFKNCTSTHPAVAGLKTDGATCADAQKLSKTYQTRTSCMGKPCSIRVSGAKWQCQPGQPVNRCTTTVEGDRFTVKWRFAGGEHG